MRDVVVIGNGPGGSVAAMTARKHYKDANVTLVKREEKTVVPCSIPYVFNTLGDLDKNLFMPRYDEMGINVVVGEVEEIKREKKKVMLANGKELGYDKLLLATGSSSAKIPIEGSDLKNVFFVKKDYDYLSGFLKAVEGKKKIVIIGGGFIGVELGDEFCKRGMEVSIVELLPHCLQLVFDDDFAELGEQKLRESGIKLFTGRKVERIIGEDGEVRGVELDTGERLEADVVVIAVGVAKETKLAKGAGLDVDDRMGVKVDEYQRTSDGDIFAVGDCTFRVSFFTKKPSMLMLASISAYEARIAGANLFEQKRKNEGVIGTFSTGVGDLALSMSGLSERAAKEESIKYVVGVAEIPDKHPPSMPGMRRIKTKLLFNAETQEITGAQFAGSYVVGEIANIVAIMIQNRMKIDDVATAQIGTHPLLTAPPVFYHIAQAAEDAKTKL
ncbi:FAD-dependent pyridine nucleotide-disulfideoxidoreductase [groundwater metagenome]